MEKTVTPKRLVVMGAVLIVLTGAVVAVMLHAIAPRARPMLAECRSDADKTMCDQASAAYSECRRGEYTYWGRVQCLTSLRLHDECRDRYRQEDEAACVVVAFDVLKCISQGASAYACGNLGEIYLDCLNVAGHTVSGCKKTRNLYLYCLLNVHEDQRCKDLPEDVERVGDVHLESVKNLVQTA
ncbi:hypothetical protein AAH991_35945 [Microbispora sp. ZYX-F-249]|uniref:Phospholipase n=1 Tax=Microbispora maris TaxID=3144104 RepID=A0ABV0AZ46_9ACTN